MQCDISFLRDEVRNGFYIPTAIKQCFAAQLSVLESIDNICRKHNINYFADWGSLLAAVRHGGYIPWDDDLDIGMKRSDYKKFMEYAKSELPEEYDIHTFETKENHWLFITKILGTKRICFDPDYLNNNNNFPYIPCVDIFLVDNLYKDSDKERERSKDIKYILSLADGIVEGKIAPDVYDKLLGEIEKKYNIRISRSLDNRHIGIELYKLVETRMGEVSDDDAGNVGQIFPWVLNGGQGYPKKYYDSFIRLPFENTTIPVPASYNEALKLHYGDYLAINRNFGAHDYPFFEAQKENLMKLANFELPEYRFSPDLLEEINYNDSSSLKTIILQGIDNLTQMFSRIVASDFIDIALLNDMQQLAIDMGTVTELCKGEGTESVHQLELICEIIYSLTNNTSNELIQELKCAIDKYSELAHEEIISKRVVVFLTICPSWWNNFNSFYKKEMENADVYVVPLPTFKKDAYGRIIYNKSFDNDSLIDGAFTKEQIRTITNMKLDRTLVDYQLTGYPDFVKLYDFEKFNLSLHSPDAIYIQEASDNENPCLSVPRDYYSNVISQYTKELIYILPQNIDDFPSGKKCETYNMKHYVYKPGVIRANKIYVNSETIKERFAEGLCSFCENAVTKDSFYSKINVMDYHTHISSNSGKKTILYCIGANELNESNDFISGIRKRLDTLTQHNSINTLVTLFPSDDKVWKDINYELYNKMLDLLNNYNVSVISSCDNKKLIDSCDAYYGAPSPYVRDFADCKKPVMIEALDLY